MISLVSFALVTMIFSLSTVATIGFVNTSLSISENGGELEFEIAVLDGDLRFDVPVNFATDNGTALGIQYCIHFLLYNFRV